MRRYNEMAVGALRKYNEMAVAPSTPTASKIQERQESTLKKVPMSSTPIPSTSISFFPQVKSTTTLLIQQ
jgi:hypothetical protein